MLTILDYFPKKILNAPAQRLFQYLTGPTLIHLAGRRKEPLFVSTLLHGNEITGVLVAQELLKRYAARELPRALSIFIGNVEAARYGKRRLAGQRDYNRIWRDGTGAESAMARGVMDEMRRRGPFLSVDIHNNTGFNPHYACVTTLDRRYLCLAAMFDRRVVFFNKPDTTLTHAFSDVCPSVTLECGLPGSQYGVEHTVEFLDGCLHMAEPPDREVCEHDLDLYHSMIIVKPAEGVRFGFCPDDVDLCFHKNLDRLNFRTLKPGALFARVGHGCANPLEAWDENGREVSEAYFTVANGEVRLKREVMPSMLTLNEEAIRQDCLCYFMERMPYPFRPGR